jgi:hypothetical protein
MEPASSGRVACRHAVLGSSPQGDLRARTEVELVQDVLDVGRHRAFRDDQLLGDLAVAEAPRQERRDFVLPCRKQSRWCGRNRTGLG